jgi:hypothetical protein
VAIRASAAREIDTLIARLAAPDATLRDAAVARLIVIGARAVERLLLAAHDSAATVRVAAWRALEGIGDARSLVPALAALDDRDPLVAAAAALAAGRFVRADDGVRVVDRLSAIAIDGGRATLVRRAALHALRDLDPATTAPLVRALRDRRELIGDTEAFAAAPRQAAATKEPAAKRRLSRAAPVRSRQGTGSRRPRASSERNQRGAFDDDRPQERSRRGEAAARIASAAGGALLDDAAALRADIADAGGEVPVPLLVQVIDRVRAREGAETAAARPAWTLARAAAHLAVARRNSRSALYDLRETLESATAPLPVEMLQALRLVGDAGSLEAIAAAHARAADRWSRQQLSAAFYAIVERERLTARSPALRRLGKNAK